MASTYTEARGLDVKKLRGDTRQVEPVRLRRGENGLTNIEGHITADGEPYNLTGMTVKFRAVNRARQFINDTARITNAASGIVTYTVTNTLTSVEGEAFVAYFEFSDGSNIITSDTIPILVLENTDISTEQADEYKNQIDRLLDELEGKIGDVSGAVKNANDAATKANTATTNATNAATKANNAATSANNAATEARNAATEASDAVAGANAAKDAANNAANNANTAAQDANSAASRANNAATRVDDAVTSATEAANNANQAASNMEAHINAAKMATDSANEAADAANTATAEANNAASDAANAAVSANTAADTVNNAMKTYKTIVSEVSTWAINDSGTDIPTFWNESKPTPEKGRWLWERRQTNYNQGSPTIVYVPTYSGRDGEFDGEYRVQYLEGKVNDMNDLTTGINLLMGTRDFLEGENTSDKRGSYFPDGFYYTSKASTLFDKDASGFSVLYSLQSSGSSVPWVSSSYVPIDCITSGYVTYGFWFLIDDISNITDTYTIGSLYFRNSSNANVSINNITLRSIGYSVSNIETGKWYRATMSVNVPDAQEINYFSFSIGLIKGIYFKKMYAYDGRINNPIWSPSPFDIDRINDETTGINLLRGTRDFLRGNEAAGTTHLYNGWKEQAAFTDYVDDDGFTVTHVERFSSVTSTIARYQAVKGDFKAGEVVTFAFDVMVDDTSSFTSTVLGQLGIANKSNSVFISSTAKAIYSRDYNIVAGEWTRIVFPYVFTQDVTEDSYFLVSLTINNNGSVRFKKASLYRGRINNPVYSVSPFDVVQVSEQNAYPNGTYAGVSIAEKFANEIRSNHIATWLQSRVKAANFSGLNIMDYVDIVIDGVTVRYRIAAIDPYYTTNSPQNGHHIYFVPDSAWKVTSNDADYLTEGALQWNKKLNNNGTSENESPYLASNLHKWEIEKHLPRFPQEWQDAMIDLNVYLETRYSSGATLERSSGRINAKMGKVFSPSEAEIFGRAVAGTKYFSESHDAFLPRFSLPKNRYINSTQYWTRTVADGSSRNAVVVGVVGNSSSSIVDNKYVSPLPCFAIG